VFPPSPSIKNHDISEGLKRTVTKPRNERLLQSLPAREDESVFKEHTTEVSTVDIQSTIKGSKHLKSGSPSVNFAPSIASISEQILQGRRNQRAHEQLSVKIEEIERRLRLAKDRNKKQAEQNQALNKRLEQDIAEHQAAPLNQQIQQITIASPSFMPSFNKGSSVKSLAKNSSIRMVSNSGANEDTFNSMLPRHQPFIVKQEVVMPSELGGISHMELDELQLQSIFDIMPPNHHRVSKLSVLSPTSSAISLEDRQKVARMYEDMFLGDLRKKVQYIRDKNRDAKLDRDLVEQQS